MRKLLLCGVALLALGAAVPAQAASTLGAAGGATTGATLGFIFGGPIGAVVGGFSGAIVGSQVSDASITFAGNHPVEQVYVSDNVDVGYHVGSSIKVYPIDGDAGHGYFYANNRVWIVDRDSGKVVASPGYLVSDSAVTYARSHPTASVSFSGQLAPGVKLGSNITFSDIPDGHGYSYVYINDRPALVDAGSRTVIWIDG